MAKKKKGLKVSPPMAETKNSLKVTAEKKKSHKIAEPVQSSSMADWVKTSPMAYKKKSRTKKNLKVTAEVQEEEPMNILAQGQKKKLKPDSEIISILREQKLLYQSQQRVVIPGCVSRPFSEVLRGPAPGALLGRLVFKEDGRIVDCSRKGPEGRVIPCMIDNRPKIKIISSDALFILLVENISAYQMLALNEFYNRFPCIMINSEQAIPDTGTRMFLKMLYTQLNLPVLALVDSTAQGLRSLYSYYQNEIDPLNLHIPDIKWLGARPTDLLKHGMPRNCMLRMKPQDIKMVKDLLKCESVKKNPGWVFESNSMVARKQMAEIEAFAAVDHEYLWEVYLPLMLQEQNWLCTELLQEGRNKWWGAVDAV